MNDIKNTRNWLEKELGLSYNEIINLDLDEEIELIRIHNIEKKTGISYNEFLQLDVLTQMNFYKKLDLDFPKNKSIDNQVDEMIDKITPKSKFQKILRKLR